MSDLKRRLGMRYPAGDGPFLWPGVSSWIYVYSTRVPISLRAIAFVVAGNADPTDEVELSRFNSAKQVTGDHARACNVPFGEIRFVADQVRITEFRLNGVQLTEDQLRDWFDNCGLPVRKGGPVHVVNRGLPSLFSSWMRSNLGDISIADIDLMRISEADSTLEVIYELKRSHIPLAQWKPYLQDFQVFDVLSRVAAESDARFRILYNVMSRSAGRAPRPDDASRVSLFSYATGRGSTHLRTMSFDDFVDGEDL